MPLYSVEIRQALTSVHKVTIGICLTQLLLAIITAAIAGSLSSLEQEAKDKYDTNPNPNSSGSVDEGDAIAGLLSTHAHLALTYSIPLIILQVVGVIAYGAYSRGGAIVYTVFNSLFVIYGIIMVAIPALESTAFSIICDLGPNESYTDFGKFVCNDVKSRVNAVTALMAINICISFVLAILGCVGSGSIGKQAVVYETSGAGYVQPPQPYDPYIPNRPNYAPQNGAVLV